jgi:flagellar biosynthesis/type III secretory pathway protein FliH
LSRDVSTLRLRVSGPPSGARIVQGTLDDFREARLAEREERVRAEGAELALQGPTQALESALAALEDERQRTLTSISEHAARIGVEIAQALLRKELKEGNYDLPAIVRSVLEQSSAGGPATLRVNPEDVAALEAVALRTGTTVEADPSVRRADVHLETAQGVLVREVDACLATIRENLEEALYR